LEKENSRIEGKEMKIDQIIDKYLIEVNTAVQSKKEALKKQIEREKETSRNRIASLKDQLSRVK
jgi:hypothetical protein